MEKVQSSYLESINACSDFKLQQSLRSIPDVDTAGYTSVAASLQAVAWRMVSAQVIYKLDCIWHIFELDRIGWQWRRIAMVLHEWSGHKDCVSVVMRRQVRQ